MHLEKDSWMLILSSGAAKKQRSKSSLTFGDSSVAKVCEQLISFNYIANSLKQPALGFKNQDLKFTHNNDWCSPLTEPEELVACEKRGEAKSARQPY
uniref:Uncharacterized protein n=1 Tax=Sphaerodactylus townsendi TaxID=933632 RepID=A0ACB8FKI1_9SAUR